MARRDDQAPVPFSTALSHELGEIAAAREQRRVAALVEPPGHDPLRAANRSDLLGLALSGGGIRSATFNLGVLQTLARIKLLRRIDYLSTVSGGGYIGGWLAAWIKRTGDIDEVERALATADAIQPRHPVTFLRELSNYLTPRKGLFGLDAWTVAITYVRNAALHLLVLALTLTAVLLGARIVALLFDHVAAMLALGRRVALAAVPLGAVLLSAAVITLLFRNLSRLVASDPTATSPLTPPSTARKRRSGWTHGIIAPLLVADAWLVAAALGGLGTELDRAALWLPLLGLAYGGLWLLGWLVFDSARVARTARGAGRGPTAVLTPLAAFVPAAVGGMLGAALLWGLGRLLADAARSAWWWSPAAFGTALVVAAFGAAAVLQIGLAGGAFTDEARELLGRLGASVARITSLLTVLLCVALLGPPLVGRLGSVDWALVGGWVLTTGTGVLVGYRPSTGGPRTQAALAAVARVAPFVFILGFLLLLAAAGQWLLDRFDLAAPEVAPGAVLGDPRLWAVLAALVGATLLLSWRVGINRFSMHALYRDRLVRCYLGASNTDRAAHPFTGFDPTDDEFHLAAFSAKRTAYQGPFPIVNATLNLVGGRRLAWQERRAAGFAFTPGYCGYQPHLDAGLRPRRHLRPHGYHRADAYGGGLSLGTAMAVSGAALNPNMGYHSSPSLSFLMTMFNVRLGWWAGNPRHATTWDRNGPSIGLFALIAELLGRTNDESRFVHLSDGGHFENLALYELVRRRCRFVIACDAEQDAACAFPGLGNAVERCRADFGVPIEIDTRQIRPLEASRHGRWHCAVGRIRYSAVDPDALDGTLVYLKASLTGNEPQDVATYAACNAEFPQESTVDQWFSESQFESYRALGEHAAAEVLRGAGQLAPDGSLEAYFVELQKRWYPPSDTVGAGADRHARAMGAILETIRTTPELAYMDPQLYPVLDRLARRHDTVPAERWPLPKDHAQLRSGFYLCQRIIGLMEDVYHDLALESAAGHPDNRGWINLFHRWSWSRMFRFTWSVTAGTYGSRFQTFCERQLHFRTGAVRAGESQRVDPELIGAAGDPNAFWIALEERTGLDYFERRLLQAFCDANAGTGRFLAVPLRLVIEDDPMADDRPFGMNVGFAVVRDRHGDAPALGYFRIQSQLRNMGLARLAVRALLGEERFERLALDLGVMPADAPEGTTDSQRAYFAQLFESVQRDLRAARRFAVHR